MNTALKTALLSSLSYGDIQKITQRKEKLKLSSAFGCFTLEGGIHQYPDQIKRHYPAELIKQSERQSIPHAYQFSTFGAFMSFESPTDVMLYDDELKALPLFRQLVSNFGVLHIHNAYLPDRHRAELHKNIFPHLNFHSDRSDQQENKYTTFIRDPFDPDQYEPRPSSTIFIDNVVGYLQGAIEGIVPTNERKRRSHYEIFRNDYGVKNLFGKVILEIPWNAPPGTGEICLIDNRTVLHSNFRKNMAEKGYPIGARYLF